MKEINNFLYRNTIEIVIAAVVLACGLTVTYIWTRTSHYCAEYPVIANVEDIGDKNFKVTYADGSIEYFDDFWMVDDKQSVCSRYEVAPPKGVKL